jgi:hypothetical protein
LSFEACGYAVGLKRQGWRSEEIGYSLSFGTAVHRAALGWVEADAQGVAFDAVDKFVEVWERELEENIVKFSSRFSEPDLRKIGIALVERFLEFWKREQYRVYVDEKGPFVERRVRYPIGPGVILSLEPDLAAYDRFGRLSILDLKTPAAESFDEFAEISDQLTAYQMGFEQETGFPRIDRVGYLEALKQKRRQEIVPKIAPRRSADQVAEYRQKVYEIAVDIANGRFRRSPKMAYNSPCALCDFRGLCVRGDTTGLIAPKQEKAPALDFAAA